MPNLFYPYTMPALAVKKKKNNKSLFKRISAWLHLWLGIGSGLIVMIVGLTGCMYVFEHEIKDFMEDWRFVEPQQKAFMLPSELVRIADQKMNGPHASSVTFSGRDEAAIVGYFIPKKDKKASRDAAMGKRSPATELNQAAATKPDLRLNAKRKAGGKGEAPRKRREGIFRSVYMNPYTGAILHVKSTSRTESPDFFRFMLNGHRALWLPYEIGRPIVGVGVLVFVVLLITGIVLWWPAKWIKSMRDKSFKIKWDASFKRINYDMHNVLGFYSMIFLLMISMTGLVWSFQWWSKSVYWVTSGGKSLVDTRETPLSDTTSLKPFNITNVDKIWFKLRKENAQAASIMLSIPQKPAESISASVYQQSNTFYNMDRFNYDQQSLKELKSKSPFAGKYIEANLPDKIRRMNYDIHVGAVLGLTGKIIAFFASLICASLPVTGFLIWWGKKKKSKKPAALTKAVVTTDPPLKKLRVVKKEEEPVYS